MTTPSFAIVGHPNKGKSSLVATLARDSSVRIGPEPGTTIQAREFPLRVGEKVLYTLIDTPGFQRARAVLEWLKSRETDAAGRPALVAEFVRTHAGEERFRNECELLRPIVEGAGLIYVVDGATPYGADYDAEMEILRWTGQPGLAVINPIGQPRFVEPWQRALEQFFRVVRVLDVQLAPFEQQIELLTAFGKMSAAWQRPVEEAVMELVNHRRQQSEDAAGVMAELIAGALTHRETKDLAGDESPARYTAGLEATYRESLRQMERQARGEVEAVYGFTDLDREEMEMDLLETDLLSQESWLVFGLRKRDLVMAGAAGGALTGGVIDASLLGSSFLTGTVIGGAVGGVLGYFSSMKLAEVKVLHQPLGGMRIRCGPTRNVQFPFVLLARARLHHDVVAGRTHAQRGVMKVKGQDGAEQSARLPEGSVRRMGSLFKQLQKSDPGTAGRAAALADLTQAITLLIQARDGEVSP